MLLQVDINSWVLGWHFSAGERIQLDRDVFGDDGIFDVYLSDAAKGGPASPSITNSSRASGSPQGVAVFSKC